MSLHPLKHLSLVFQSNVKITPFPNLITSQKSVGANTIVKSDNDNILPGGFNESYATVVRAGIRIEAATLDINKNW
jgi:hypothetical protein